MVEFFRICLPLFAYLTINDGATTANEAAKCLCHEPWFGFWFVVAVRICVVGFMLERKQCFWHVLSASVAECSVCGYMVQPEV